MPDERRNQGGRKLPVDPEAASLAGLPTATRGLVATLNRLLTEADTSYVAVARDQRLRDRKFIWRQMHPARWPRSACDRRDRPAVRGAHRSA